MFSQRVRYRGVTHLGKELDPLADKARFLGVLLTLGPGLVHSSLIVACCIASVALTLARPIKKRFGFGNIGSNRAGKYKLVVQLVALSLLILLPGLLSDHSMVILTLDLCFAVALVFAVASLFGQIISSLLYWRRRKP